MNDIEKTFEKQRALAKEAQEIIGQLRAEFGLSVSEIAGGIGVSDSTVLAWEKLDQVPVVQRLGLLREFRDGHELARSKPSKQREEFPDAKMVDAALEQFGEAWNTIEPWSEYISRMEAERDAEPVVFESVKRGGDGKIPGPGSEIMADNYRILAASYLAALQQSGNDNGAMRVDLHSALDRARFAESRCDELRERAEAAENERDFYKEEHAILEGTIADLSNAATEMREELDIVGLEGQSDWVAIEAKPRRPLGPMINEIALLSFIGEFQISARDIASFKEGQAGVKVRRSWLNESLAREQFTPQITHADQLAGEARIAEQDAAEIDRRVTQAVATATRKAADKDEEKSK
jgi:DNA-binding transcriptional regulator YiaG